MNLKPINVGSIPNYPFMRKTKITAVLDEFLAMDAEAVEIDAIAEGYKTSGSLSSTLIKACSRLKIGTIKIMTTGDKVYLIKVKE